MATVVLALLPSCGADTPDPAPLDAAAVCPGGTEHDGVVVCAELHEGDAPVALPADGGDVRYGAVARGGEQLLTRSGALALPEALRTQLTDVRRDPDADSGASGRGDVAATSGPYAQLVYRATVEDGRLTALEPVVRVEEAALLTRVFGGAVLEGAIAPFLGADEGYDLTPQLPVRVELEQQASGPVLRGEVVNADAAVRTSDGACAPALSDAGDRDPLQGDPYSAAIALQRYPSMHAPFDDELLLEWSPDASNMGGDLYPSAAHLLGLEPLGTVWQAMPHGNPTSGPALVLRRVDGGGGAC